MLRRNYGEYITIPVPIKKELDNGKTITYKLKFIDAFKFMSSKLSDLVDNSSEIFSQECRDKNFESESEFDGFKNNKIFYKCKEC